MHDVELVFGLLLAVTGLVWLSERLRLPYPIFLTVGGLVLGLIPTWLARRGIAPGIFAHLPTLQLRPDLVFTLFLPPLLYHAGMQTTWRDFRANIRSISFMAIGLVLFTTVAIAAVAHSLIPELSWPAAFVLGSIVSPPDAIAATTILQRLRIPRRIITVLEGESLVNDATALVAYRFAIAATVAGTFSLERASVQFVLVAAGGIGMGLIFGMLAMWVRKRLRTSSVDPIVSLLTPYVSYLPAEWAGVSGVLAVVTAGLYVSRRIPSVVTPTNRLRMYAVWEVLIFLLNGLVFITIGLQLPYIVERLGSGSLWTLSGYATVVSIAAILIRLIWVFSATYATRKFVPWLTKRDPMPPWPLVFLVGWTSIRGIVSLAAALALPLEMGAAKTPFPGRDLIIFITFGVILFTLVVQGLTLPLVIRLLEVQGDDGDVREEDLARLEIANAALSRLTALSLSNDGIDDLIEKAREPYETDLRRFAARVRPAAAAEPFVEPIGVCHNTRDIQHEVLIAKRLMLIRLRDDGSISDEVLRKIQEELDHDEVRFVLRSH